MGFGNTLQDGRGGPISSVIVPGTVIPQPLRGGNASSDSNSNPSASACFVRDCTTVLTQASAAQTANGNASGLAVGAFTEIAIDANITAITGTSPTIQFFIDRLGADGATYFNIWSSSAISAVSALSTSIGAGLAVTQSFGSIIRFRWVVGGTSPSFTFSASIIGK
jgi:hypothetical protein